MVELVNLAWGRRIHLGLDLNKGPMEGNDVDDRPTPIVKLLQAYKYAQLLSNFVVEHPSYRVVYPDVMTVSCRHDVSCRDGPLRHDTIGST